MVLYRYMLEPEVACQLGWVLHYDLCNQVRCNGEALVPSHRFYGRTARRRFVFTREGLLAWHERTGSGGRYCSGSARSR